LRVRNPCRESLKVIVAFVRTLSPLDDRFNVVVPVPQGRRLVTVAVSGLGCEMVVTARPPEGKVVVMRSLVEFGRVTVVVPFTTMGNSRRSDEKARKADSEFWKLRLLLVVTDVLAGVGCVNRVVVVPFAVVLVTKELCAVGCERVMVAVPLGRASMKFALGKCVGFMRNMDAFWFRLNPDALAPKAGLKPRCALNPWTLKDDGPENPGCA
jgi:hypothetical protein